MKAKKHTKKQLLKKLSELGVRDTTDDPRGPTAFELPGSSGLHGNMAASSEQKTQGKSSNKPRKKPKNSSSPKTSMAEMTSDQAEQLELESYEEDVRRHRIMKGHPPEGPIFEMRSDEEIQQRIAELRKRAEESLKRLQDVFGKKQKKSS